MKFTLSWLKRFLNTTSSIEEISHTLTMLGLEVEDIVDQSIPLAPFIVAEILTTAQHPDADKLKICTVQTGAETLQIVCGAANARAGIKVVLAKIGTLIPNGVFKIKQSKIRGIDSFGMLCSGSELNIIDNDNLDGIMELPEDAIVGDSFGKYLGLDDLIFHISITPNRGDALGVYGIARDLAAAGLGTLKDLVIAPLETSFTSSISVNVRESEACPLYIISEIKNINNNVKSPNWLKFYLKNIGINSISPVVDITNYISYSFGQPMHAYDADKLVGDLTIESLKSTTKFFALNNKEYELIDQDLIIKDDQEIQCLAGIIGGVNSSCNENTSRIILEAACFNPTSIMHSGRRMMIDTDSRYRFERSVNREFTLDSLKIAIHLIKDICGGESSNIIVQGNTKLPTKIIEFPIDFLLARSGIDLPIEKIISILAPLGFQVTQNENILNIMVPAWRPDVSIKEDIVEEIIRIYGYDKIPETPMPGANISKIIPREVKRISQIKRLLASNAYTEIVTWSFMNLQKAKLFSEIKEELILQNPISSDLNYMRPSIIPNLLQIAQNNINRSFKDLALFEIGPIFEHANSEITLNSIAGIRTGSNLPKNHHETSRLVDIFDIKADIGIILEYAGLSIDKLQIRNENTPTYYHPTRSASLHLGKNVIAHFGQIHPRILKKFDIEIDVMGFELNLPNLPFTKEKFGKRGEYIASDYQAITRDYAFIVDQNQAVGEILSFIQNIDKKLIKSVNLFDIYQGNNIDPNKKSIALSVYIQDDDKTLNESDIEEVNQAIIGGVQSKFFAILRDQ